MSTRTSVICFLVISAFLGGYYGVVFRLERSERTVHLPGETSPGHHQIEGACEQCHTPFEGVKNDKCIRCHDHKAEQDSHRVEMFADPRNAERAGGLDAQQCVTCHREHVPDRTVAGVTIADDFCAGCHKEVFEDRPSHKDLSPTGCSASGCHNYHDNRALYETFLRKHKDEPDQKSPPKVIVRLVAKGSKALLKEDQDAPREVSEDPKVAPGWPALLAEWEDSAHAQAGVNCTGCHRAEDPEGGGAVWESKVDHAACAVCHVSEDAGFLKGRHGMRLALSLPPMTPATARLPMTPEAKPKEPGSLVRLWHTVAGDKVQSEAKPKDLGCNSCHIAHTFNPRAETRDAAVDVCLGCHADEHSHAYKDSSHFKLWELERKRKAEPGTGVSCATCHLPREELKEGDASRTRVQHNQNDNLRPNDKMLRGVCMSCHGLGFSMDALADRALIDRNFNGRPSTKLHVKSLDWVKPRLGDKSKKGE
jgi:predicted CXXCH cytochrome family protein